MNGVINKRFKSAEAGFFFIMGADGREYYANRHQCSSFVRKHWNSYVKEGASVVFVPVENVNKTDRKGRPARPEAHNIDFLEERQMK